MSCLVEQCSTLNHFVNYHAADLPPQTPHLPSLAGVEVVLLNAEVKVVFTDVAGGFSGLFVSANFHCVETNGQIIG